ncbi:MAG: 1,4-alpha-glucan branching protein GlgB [Burkholderiaceae bacterium]|nr:1,4-alpha-glucan branching protein GlgB [Burkholderiaceae bacterium]
MPVVPAGGAQAPSLLTAHDIYLFREGTHCRLYEKLGAHACVVDGVAGVQFAVWAPNAARVSMIGDFNGWAKGAHPCAPRADHSGIWECFIPGVQQGDVYKFHIESSHHGYAVDKADPFAVYAELPPRTGSRVWSLDYAWGDQDWMARRRSANALDAPISVYEVHLGSWRRVPEEGQRFLSYREIAPLLAEHVQALGFTHVELLPVMEHPFYGSWGYQTTGYFAPTSRYGTPQDFMYLIDYLHQAGIGVILDWVPSHFPTDAHGLAFFDGTHLFEHADPRQGFHPEWSSAIFNYGRNEVRAFLLSSAMFWLEHYHVDGLRVDAVASMLYLDYARPEGEWIANHYGGRENLQAIDFVRQLNMSVYRDHPDVQTYAEESTAWPMVSRPVAAGGLGFGLKWNMGWMHDTLRYFQRDPLYRRHHHGQISFSIWYAFNENFILPLSHDEVVHGKGALIGKMPGDEWQQFANLRLLYGTMWAHPGKKLLFMGGEFGQRREWQHEESLEWHVLQYPLHAGVQRWVSDLNRCQRAQPALHAQDFGHEGFAWVDFHDAEASVLSFLRRGREVQDAVQDVVLVVCNFTPVPRAHYRVGVPHAGYWQELLNSDATAYGGSGMGNGGGAYTEAVPAHGYAQSLSLLLPPLGVLYLKPAAG